MQSCDTAKVKKISLHVLILAVYFCHFCYSASGPPRLHAAILLRHGRSLERPTEQAARKVLAYCTMSSTQSVPASSSSAAQADAAAHALESLVLGDDDQQQHHVTHEDGDEENSEDDHEDSNAEIGVAGSSGAPSNGDDAASAAETASSSSKKKKKKSKSKGKGKAALDKLKGALSGSGKGVELDDDDNEPDARASGSSSVAGKKPTPPISDALYRRIMDEAKKNLSAEEASKLDRQAVAEMVECENPPVLASAPLSNSGSPGLTSLIVLSTTALNLRDVISGKSSGISVGGKNKK